MDILETIIPIFSVILLGWLARNKGFVPKEFLGPANRLVYYFAIPAMVFRAIAKGSLKNDFDPLLLGCTLGAVFLGFGLTWFTGILIHMPQRRFGTFVQNSFHGNLGYIGLAVCYYFLGPEGFTNASLLVGFIMILQNFLSVLILQVYAGSETTRHHSLKNIIPKVLGNPVVLSALAGILFSLANVEFPLVLARTLDIIGGLALPLALLLIGASLNFKSMKIRFRQVLVTGFIKLVLLPGIGLTIYSLVGLGPELYLPGLILLASPSATISYVMAMEMKGDVEFAVAAISASTLVSALTFSLWLHISAFS